MNLLKLFIHIYLIFSATNSFASTLSEDRIANFLHINSNIDNYQRKNICVLGVEKVYCWNVLVGKKNLQIIDHGINISTAKNAQIQFIKNFGETFSIIYENKIHTYDQKKWTRNFSPNNQLIRKIFKYNGKLCMIAGPELWCDDRKILDKINLFYFPNDFDGLDGSHFYYTDTDHNGVWEAVFDYRRSSLIASNTSIFEDFHLPENFTFSEFLKNAVSFDCDYNLHVMDDFNATSRLRYYCTFKESKSTATSISSDSYYRDFSVKRLGYVKPNSLAQTISDSFLIRESRRGERSYGEYEYTLDNDILTGFEKYISPPHSGFPEEGIDTSPVPDFWSVKKGSLDLILSKLIRLTYKDYQYFIDLHKKQLNQENEYFILQILAPFVSELTSVPTARIYKNEISSLLKIYSLNQNINDSNIGLDHESKLISKKLLGIFLTHIKQFVNIESKNEIEKTLSILLDQIEEDNLSVIATVLENNVSLVNDLNAHPKLKPYLAWYNHLKILYKRNS